MAGACCGGSLMPGIDPSPCNGLVRAAGGLLVPRTAIEVGPGLTLDAPAAGDCPQTWTLGVDGSWAQTTWGAGGSRTLSAADRVWEEVTEVAPLVAPRSGVWEVTYHVRGGVQLPANLAIAQYVVASLFRNGTLIGGSEVMVVGLSRGQASGSAAGAQNTGTASFMINLTAGDQITLHAYQIGQSGVSSVVSNQDGRTRVTARWTGPVGDTP
ncbi:hypothetical protein [Streptomyces sp. NPDC001068]|uniref:hypothetical protein n=1 Tax=Streptomyces sp. NPDC001068 TaxID=3364544 RepID=UPI0036CA3F6E